MDLLGGSHLGFVWICVGCAVVKGNAKVDYATICGCATIAGPIEVRCKKLNKGRYDCENDFHEKTPERSYEKAFISVSVDNHMSSVERMDDERRRTAFRMFLGPIL